MPVVRIEKPGNGAVLCVVRQRLRPGLPALRRGADARRTVLHLMREAGLGAREAARATGSSDAEPTRCRSAVASRCCSSTSQNFTALAESMDPEEVRSVQSRYFEVARSIVATYGGTIEKFIGDAVMAIWGAPLAHEDDAERAVRAALAIVYAVDRMGGAAAGRALRGARRRDDR